jgi:UDP-hydrolysing UDP-N-acetyl-D-glucosamine 2-epimerase
MSRRVCVPITSRAYYGRSRSLLRRLQEHPDVDLQIVLAGSILLEKYGKNLVKSIRASNFPIVGTLFNVVEGGNHVAMAKTACLTALEFTNTFYTNDPDIVLIVGDRYEQLAIAMAAAYLNKTIAHIEGGDATGSIDESVRHAITKLAHIHFVTNDDAARRVLRMGEDPAYVFNTGSLDIEQTAEVDESIDIACVNRHGVGHEIDTTRPFLVVIQHPVATMSDNRALLQMTIRAVADTGVPAVFFWPNADAGTDEMAEAIRHYREASGPGIDRFRFITNLQTDEFITLLRRTVCLVGNSSAGIKEASFLGTPTVNIGGRQQGRLAGRNVLHVDHDLEQIRDAIVRQLAHGPYERSLLYYKPGTSARIVEVLASLELYTQKRFFETS